VLQTRRAHLHSLSLLLGAPALASAAAAQEASKIRVLVIPADLFAGAYYAQANGFFTRAHLDVDCTTTSNGGANVAAVIGGAGDIGISNPVSIAAAVTRGAPLTIIAGAGLYTSNAASTALCVVKSSPLRTVKDLDQKTIGVTSINDSSTVAVREYLVRGGVELDRVHFVEIPFPIMGPALQQGRVDAAMIPEPFLSIAASKEARIFSKPFDVIAPQFLLSVWFSTTNWVKNNPDEAKRFASTMYACGRWANSHHDETAVNLANLAHMDIATIRAMTRGRQAESLSPGLIQPLLDVAFKFNLLTRAVHADDMIAKA